MSILQRMRSAHPNAAAPSSVSAAQLAMLRSNEKCTTSKRGVLMRRIKLPGSILLIVAILTSCATGSGGGKWVTLFDGKTLDQWNTIGTANWRIADGAVQADQGSGFLVSKN